MRLSRSERIIVGVNLVYMAAFTAMALSRANYEFVLYALVVIFIAGVILSYQPRIGFKEGILWGLSIWGLLHMAGGNLRVGGDVLYSLQLIPVVLRYDQLVHAFGFGTATLVCHHLLRPYLRNEPLPWWPLAGLVVLMGSGLGAMNEILEFVAVKVMPETNVGGYNNTLWDLVFNLLGGLTATGLLVRRNRLGPLPTPDSRGVEPGAAGHEEFDGRPNRSNP